MPTRNKMNAITERPPSHLLPSAYWQSMRFSHLYRLVLACALVAYYFFWQDQLWRDHYSNILYFKLALGYLCFSLMAMGISWSGLKILDRQLTLITIIDIAFIVALIYAAGGLESGLGVLLVIAVATASLFSQGRLALFYAAIASIALLLEQSYEFVTWNQFHPDYTHAAMLSMGCFATAWLAHSLSKRTIQSEALASQRGIDLENLAQINQLITQEMQDGVLVVDRELRLRHRNVQAEDLLSNRHANTLMLSEYAPEVAALLNDWMQEGEPENIHSGIARLKLNDRDLRLRFMPIGHYRHDGAVIFIEDWSHMQIQAQQVKLAALGRLTANIAHEIRNPLSAISHANQLLQEEEPPDPGITRMLQIIQDNVQRLDQIVKDVLELNRRDRTQQELFSLRAFLEEFHTQFCLAERVPADSFKLFLAGHDEEIKFDRRHLNQVLWNVCRNGWRHGKQGKGSLSLSLLESPAARTISLAIKDDGPGVTEAMVQRLFEPFFTTETTGTGLGLYIARELCEANGGSIRYQSALNGGLFVIQLKRQMLR